MNSQDENQPIKENKKTKLSFQAVKLIVATSVIFTMFSGLSIYTGKLGSEAKIRVIEAKIERRDRVLMAESLNQCSGDLTNREVVRECVENYKNKLIEPHKKELTRLSIYSWSWLIFWVFVIGFFWRKLNPTVNLNQIGEVVAAVFNRLIVSKFKKFSGKK